VPPTHAPALQVWPAPQDLPHMPQFRGLLPVSTQVPLHNICPAAQPHVPFTQPCPVPQTWPQLPQLFRSDATVTQAPEQLVSPLEQVLEHVD